MPRKASAQVLKLSADNKQLRAELKQVRNELGYTNKAVDNLAAKTDKMDSRSRKAQQGLRGVRSQARRTRMEFQRTAASVGQLNHGLRTLLPQFAALSAVGYGVQRALRAGFSAAISFDRQLTIVQKTTKVSNEEMARLRDRIIEVSSTLGISRDEVAGSAAVAGRLGINRVGPLGEIAEIAAQLDKATNTTAERATEALTKILVLTKRDVGSLREAADALVHIANTSPVAEAAILDRAVELAAVIGRFEGTPKDILATAAALGIAEGQAAGAATAYTRLLTNISILGDEGGPRLERMARLMGRSTDQMAEDIRSNAVPTLQELLILVQEFDAVSQGRILGDIGGISDLRSRQAALRLAPHLAHTRRVAGEANNALNIEDAIRRGRTSGQLDVLVNRTSNALSEFADTLTEGSVDVADFYASFATELYDDLKGVIVGGFTRAFDAIIHEIVSGRSAIADALNPEDAAARAQARGFAARASGPQGGGQSNLPPNIAAAIAGRVDAQGNNPLTGEPASMTMVNEVNEIMELFGQQNAEAVELLSMLQEVNRQAQGSGTRDDLLTLNPHRLRTIANSIRSSSDADPVALAAANLRLSSLLGSTPGAPSQTFRGLSQFPLAGPAGSSGALTATGGRRRYDPSQGPVANTSPLFTGPAAGFGPGREVLRAFYSAQESAANARLARRGGFTAAAGGEFQLAQLRSGEEQQRRQAVREREMLDQQQEDQLRDEEHEKNLRLLRQEAADERFLLSKLREGATAEEIAYFEELLQISRDYQRARATLEKEELDAELARLDRRRAELGDGPEKEGEETINQQIARRSADAITEAIREETSIKGAMKGLLNELAAEMLDEEILKPFKENLKTLLTIGLDYFFKGGLGKGGGGSVIGDVIRGAGDAYGIPTPFARGGRARRGGMALVGEFGPELLMLPTGAQVDPLPAGGGGRGGLTLHNEIYAADAAAIEQVLERRMPDIIERARQAVATDLQRNTPIGRAAR